MLSEIMGANGTYKSQRLLHVMISAGNPVPRPDIPPYRKDNKMQTRLGELSDRSA